MENQKIAEFESVFLCQSPRDEVQYAIDHVSDRIEGKLQINSNDGLFVSIFTSANADISFSIESEDIPYITGDAIVVEEDLAEKEEADSWVFTML